MTIAPVRYLGADRWGVFDGRGQLLQWWTLKADAEGKKMLEKLQRENLEIVQGAKRAEQRIACNKQ